MNTTKETKYKQYRFSLLFHPCFCLHYFTSIRTAHYDPRLHPNYDVITTHKRFFTTGGKERETGVEKRREAIGCDVTREKRKNKHTSEHTYNAQKMILTAETEKSEFLSNYRISGAH